jgi:predicted nucleic acid-binding protein
MKFLGPAALASFLESLSSSSIQLVEPDRDDYRRAAQLIRQYSDAPLDLVDSLLVAIAERLQITTILTLDRRHFHLVRPRHRTAFEILP